MVPSGKFILTSIDTFPNKKGGQFCLSKKGQTGGLALGRTFSRFYFLKDSQ